MTDAAPNYGGLPDIIIDSTRKETGVLSPNKYKPAALPDPEHVKKEPSEERQIITGTYNRDGRCMQSPTGPTSPPPHMTGLPYNIFSSSQNLAGACADPRKSRTEMSVFFTRHWGESFSDKAVVAPLYNMPHVSLDMLQQYWNTFAKKQKLRNRAKKHALRCERAKMTRAIVPVSSGSSQSVGYTRGQSTDAAQTDLKTIPNFFLDSSFSIEDADSFASVFMTGDKERPFCSKDRLLEQLESYHDIVELHLNHQLASKSQKFFEAVKTYNALAAQLQTTTESLKRLRSMIAQLNTMVVQKSFKALYLHRARENYTTLLNKLQIVCNMREAQGSVQAYLSLYRYPEALECISAAKCILQAELKGMLCFRHLSHQLEELESVISRMLQEEFVRIAQKELSTSSPLTDDTALKIDDAEQMNCVVLGLTRLHEYRYVHVLQEEINNAAKHTVRMVIREYVADCDGVNQLDTSIGNLGDQMRKMDLEEWIALMRRLFESLCLFLLKINTIQSHLIDVIELADDSNTHQEHEYTTSEPSISISDTSSVPMDYQSLHNHLMLLNGHASNAVLERVARVLNARAKHGFLERLSMDDFMRVWQILNEFCKTCDDNAKSPILTQNTATCPLRSVMRAHAGSFVNRFHEDRKAKLANILDSEYWRAAEVPVVFQSIVDHCAQTGLLRDITTNDNNNTDMSDCLMVNGDKYILVGTALMLLQIMAQYCECLERMPFVAHELLLKLVELLKGFNSRTCQLILGAGALQLVGLKTITVKNLALSSRCLQLIMYHIPFVEREFKQALGSNVTAGAANVNLLRHLQQVVTDYNDHVHEVQNKLVSVMEFQLSTVIGKWEFRGSVPSNSFQLIAKHVRKFHEGLTAVLPDDQVQKLLLRVHDSFKRAMRARMLEMDITPRDASTWGLVCSEFSYYMDTLRSIPCCASLNDTMNDVMALTQHNYVF